MLYFEDFTQKYLSDNRGLLQLPEDKITEAKSLLRKSITLDECKSILGRKYKICLHRLLSICSYILCHQSVSFIQLSSTYNYNMYSKHMFDIDTDISLLDTFKLETEANVKSNQRALQDLQKLGIIKCVSDFKHFNSIHNDNVAYAYVFDIDSINNLLSVCSVYFKYHSNNNNNNITDTDISLLDTFTGQNHSDLYMNIYHYYNMNLIDKLHKMSLDTT